MKHIINWTVWSLLALYLVLVVSLRVPSVQRFMGAKVADAVGWKLGTDVRVGRVDLGFFNRIIIDNVVVSDQQRRELLRAGRLAVRLDLLPLAEGRVSVSSAQVFGAHVRLCKATADAPANYQFVLDSLASRDTTGRSALNLRINSLIMRHSSVTYDVDDVVPTAGHLNPAHLDVRDISAHVLLKTLTDDSLNLYVKRLSLNEQSGLQLDRLSFRLTAGLRHALLTDFVLELPDTQVQTDTLSAHYTMRQGRLQSGSLNYRGSISDSRVTPSDLRSFLPSMKNYQNPVFLSATFHGTDQSLAVASIQVSSPHDDVTLDGSGELSRWGDAHPVWNVQVHHLSLSDKTLDFLTKAVPSIPAMVRRVGSLSLSGQFSGDANGTLAARSTVGSGIGDVRLDFLLHSDRQMQCALETAGLNLRQLLDDERLGLLTTNIRLEGQLYNDRKPTIKADGTVSQFEYNDYTINNILLNGSYSADGIAGKIDIDDPNIVASLDGELSVVAPAAPPTAGQPRPPGESPVRNLRLRGTVGNFSPSALHLTDRWGEARFGASILADFTASSLNDAQGNLDISHLTMDDHELQRLHLTSGYIDRHHFLTLSSDFAQAELTGRFEYSTLAQSIINAVGHRLPTLPGLPPVTSQTENDFTLSLRLTSFDFLQHFLGIPLRLDQPLTLLAMVNAPLHHISLNATVPAFCYNGSDYQTGHLSISTPADTMRCEASLTRLSDNGGQLDLGLQAEAADNRLTTSLRWDNNSVVQPFNGVLNAVTQLYKNVAGQPEAHVAVQPSQTRVGTSVWDISPAVVTYSDRRLSVSHFTMGHGDQYVQLNGVASPHRHDSLLVDLSKVELSYILDIVGFHAVDFDGQATGRAYVTSAFGDSPAAHASLRVDKFLFEHGRMGTLQASVDWNQQRKQIDIHATANDGPTAQTFINGYVAPSASDHHPVPYIDLGITASGTYVDFMHSFTSSFLSDITGHAEGDLRLAGPLSAINLTGGLVVDGEATVTALNTTYQLRRDTVSLVYNEIILDSIAVYDKYDNIAYMSGGIHHKDLTNLTFDLQVDTDRLLAYDFHDFGTQSFYGTVLADGRVSIEGRPGRVTIDCDVTPLDGTTFVYNAAQTDAISSQKFITWKRRSEELRVKSERLRVGASAGMEFALHSSPPSTDIFLNFRINATPDATMRLLMDQKTGDYITLNGTGDLRATFHNKGLFQMFGTYIVDHGTYDVTIQNIIRKNFLFQEGGTIVFGGDPYDAALNLQALYTVNGVSLSDLQLGNSFSSNTVRVNCLMNIGGQPKAPQVTFDLEMPTVNADEQQMVRSLLSSQQEMNQQVLYLLGIGRFYNQGQNNASQQSQDQTSLAMQSFLSGTLSTQINTVLNSVLKNDQWNFGANISTGTEGWNNAEYEGIVNGRLLNNRLLINGQFGYRDKATQASPSFIGDFDIRYLLRPNGNLALKVYNQTNDRYFTRSSLNTQGVGLIMKKDFNGIGELIGNKKKKKYSNNP